MALARRVNLRCVPSVLPIARLRKRSSVSVSGAGPARTNPRANPSTGAGTVGTAAGAEQQCSKASTERSGGAANTLSGQYLTAATNTDYQRHTRFCPVVTASGATTGIGGRECEYERYGCQYQLTAPLSRVCAASSGIISRRPSLVSSAD